MLDERQFDDLREIFPTLVLFGDPAQLAPVGNSGEMVFDKLGPTRRLELHRIHRQTEGNPILDLAHALADPDLTFERFERMVEEAAARDPRVEVAQRVDSDLMARSPVLVWRNATRIRLITAFRAAHGAPEFELIPGEPLICDGIELPLKHRKKRIDLDFLVLPTAPLRSRGSNPGSAFQLFSPSALCAPAHSAFRILHSPLGAAARPAPQPLPVAVRAGEREAGLKRLDAVRATDLAQ